MRYPFKRRRQPTPESGLLRTILDGFAAHRIPAFRLNSGAMKVHVDEGRDRFVRFGFDGCPDVCALLPNRTLWVEIKSPTGRLSPAQERFRDLCWQNNIPWVLARSWEDVAQFLTRPLHKLPKLSVPAPPQLQRQSDAGIGFVG